MLNLSLLLEPIDQWPFDMIDDVNLSLLYWFLFRLVAGLKHSWKNFGIWLVCSTLGLFLGDSVSLLLDPLLLFGLATYMLPNNSRTFRLFASFYPVLVVDTLYKLLYYYLLPFVFGLDLQSMVNNPGLDYLVYGLVGIIYYALHQLLVVDFRYLRHLSEHDLKKRLQNLLIQAGIYYGLYDLYRFLGLNFSFLPDPRPYLGQLTVVFGMYFLWYLMRLERYSQEDYEFRLADENQRRLVELEDYVGYLEDLYRKTKESRFKSYQELKHLDQLIAEGQLDTIQEVYDEMVEWSDFFQMANIPNLAPISRLQVTSIKSILSTKLFFAHEQGLKVHLEIADLITRIPMETLDLVLCLSIFLDNAIEAALLSPTKEIRLAYIDLPGEQKVIIRNSIVKQDININRIFDRGYSTKGDNRGIGLSKLRDILKTYDNVSLRTRVNEGYFEQELSMMWKEER